MPRARKAEDAEATESEESESTESTESAEKPAKSKALTADDVRAIVREELGAWRHDAAHGSTQARVTAQWERDRAAGLNYVEPEPEN